jgi:cation-transporting ATPase E
VLLDDGFGSLPRVLAEGRRVLGNIERVASLFLVKTVYSLVLAVLVGVAHVPFPVRPRHVTLVGSLTIGIPGFFLALAPNHERARAGFVGRVLRFAAPAGLICALAAFTTYGLARLDTASDQTSDRSAATLALFLTATCVLALVARPYTWWRVGLLVAVLAAYALAGTVTRLAGFFALDYTDLGNDLVALVMSAVGAVAILLLPGRPLRAPSGS